DVEHKTLGEGNWKLKPQPVLKLMDRLDTTIKTKLEDLREVIHEGIITGDNTIFFVDDNTIKSKRLESGILKRVPKGRDVRKWKIIWNDRWLIYPQQTDGTPVTESEFKTAFPNAYHYLEVNKDELSNRRYYGKTVVQLFGCWYSLIHPKPENAFEGIKIVTPNLSKENNFALDKENYYFDHDTYSIILKDKSESFNKLVLGLLNSDLLEFYLKQISPYASGKYYRYMTGYLEKLPIKLPETEEEKRIAKQIVSKVDEILELNRKLSVDIDELLKREETEKLSYLASVSFSMRDDAKFERVEVKGDKIFVNSGDYVEIKDKRIRDFVIVYLNFVAEKLSKSKDVRG
ncbi:MAG: restriction endonuclease subunit S, partial [Methanophagales archaeon]|nr:restriction endonuclease subunit S [Methanophagales archaeon]